MIIQLFMSVMGVRKGKYHFPLDQTMPRQHIQEKIWRPKCLDHVVIVVDDSCILASHFDGMPSIGFQERSVLREHRSNIGNRHRGTKAVFAGAKLSKRNEKSVGNNDKVANDSRQIEEQSELIVPRRDPQMIAFELPNTLKSKLDDALAGFMGANFERLRRRHSSYDTPLKGATAQSPGPRKSALTLEVQECAGHGSSGGF